MGMDPGSSISSINFTILEGGYSAARYEGLALRLARAVVHFRHTTGAVNRMVGHRATLQSGPTACPPPDGRRRRGLLRISAGTVVAGSSHCRVLIGQGMGVINSQVGLNF